MKAQKLSDSPLLTRAWAFVGATPSQRAGAILAAGAVLVALATALHGINAPFPNGHFSSNAGIGVFSENMWRWKTLFPVMRGYLDSAPDSTSFYMHHPLGIFWVTALLEKAFGFSRWVLRLPALLYVTLTPFFLYRIGRELWGPIEGGLSALAFVALPITLAYSSYHDFEQPVMFGCVVSTWGYLRFAQTWKDRYAIVSVLGFLFAVNHDWQGYVWGAFLLAGLFVRAYVLPEGLLAPVSARSLGRYWALMCGVAVLSLGLEVVLLNKSGRSTELIDMYSLRSAGFATPLKVALAGRAYRIELMFTALAILLGKIAVPVIVGRALLKRNDLELLPIPLLLAAVVQYVVFKQGADIHIFWPHSFAAYFALAVGALGASVRQGIAWTAGIFATPRILRLRARAHWFSLALVGLLVVFVLRDGLSLVRLSHETGGRFAEANLESDVDKTTTLSWFLPRIPPGAPIQFHNSIYPTWALQWAARTHLVVGAQTVPSAMGHPSGRLFLDSRKSSLAELKQASGRFHVSVVGPYWLVEQQPLPPAIDGYSFQEREPRWFEFLSQSGTEPIRTVRPDAWVTWEWRTLLGQTAPVPATAPVTVDQIRIAHNAALTRGDAAAASAFRRALTTSFNLPLHATYKNHTELLGAIRCRGAQRSLTLYFLAGTFPTDVKFIVRAKVIAPPRFSTLPADPAELDLASPPVWPTSIWRTGQIYSVTVIYRKRPGRERLWGIWAPGGPQRTDGTDPVDIAIL